MLVCLVILLFGGAVTTLIFTTEPTATRSGATKETSMLVDVVRVERGNFTPTIKATGTVVPSQDIVLGSRVSGEVVGRSENFTPGGYVEKNEVLLQIDKADYQNELLQAKSELRQAKSDLQREMGLQQAAQREYELLDDTLTDANKALVLRKPQLESAKSIVESAEAAVQQAELDLQRTTIRAPFDAHILTRNATTGSLVAPGEDLGRLVGLNTYWVEATVPVSKLRWLNFSDEEGATGSEVKIRNRTAWLDGEYRTGYLYKMLGALEDQTRLARVLVSVPDPLATEQKNIDKPSLMIGSFVEVQINAEELTEVTRLNRDYLRTNEMVWVMEDNQLSIREVEIKFQDSEYAYISNGLNNGEQVVTTNLSTVTEGAPLRTEEDESSTESNTSE